MPGNSYPGERGIENRVHDSSTDVEIPTGLEVGAMGFQRRKEYIRNYLTNRYAQFWLHQTKVYGYTTDCQHTVALIDSLGRRLKGREMLDCPTGTQGIHLLWNLPRGVGMYTEWISRRS